MDDSGEPKFISILKDNNSEANKFLSLQIYEHFQIETVLVPHLEVAGGKELKWQ